MRRITSGASTDATKRSGRRSARRQGFVRACDGGFLRLPPVKKALMSNVLCSRFLDAMRRGAIRQGNGSFVT